jgi:hypothetical protein
VVWPPDRIVDLRPACRILGGDRAKLQFGVETFNTFNHPQFEEVGTQLNTATYGFVTDARDPRVVQLRGKISF